MPDHIPIRTADDYWKDRPGTCQFCKHARPRFNSLEYGGGQIMSNWWCHEHKVLTGHHGCGSYEREPGVEG